MEPPDRRFSLTAFTIGLGTPLDGAAANAYIFRMDKDQVIAKLRAHEAELRAAGVQALSVFGSVARNEAGDGSDLDVVVRLDPDLMGRGFGYFSSLEDLRKRLQEVVGTPVDIVPEPVSNKRLAREIEKDRQLAF
jgi:uncharacterized protein